MGKPGRKRDWGGGVPRSWAGVPGVVAVVETVGAWAGLCCGIVSFFLGFLCSLGCVWFGFGLVAKEGGLGCVVIQFLIDMI